MVIVGSSSSAKRLERGASDRFNPNDLGGRIELHVERLFLNDVIVLNRKREEAIEDRSERGLGRLRKKKVIRNSFRSNYSDLNLGYALSYSSDQVC